jgi:hypothetical protein
MSAKSLALDSSDLTPRLDAIMCRSVSNRFKKGYRFTIEVSVTICSGYQKFPLLLPTVLSTHLTQRSNVIAQSRKNEKHTPWCVILKLLFHVRTFKVRTLRKNVVSFLTHIQVPVCLNQKQ